MKKKTIIEKFEEEKYIVTCIPNGQVVITKGKVSHLFNSLNQAYKLYFK